MRADKIIRASMASRMLSCAIALQAILYASVIAAHGAADAQARPQRIVSTNLCTDQMLLRLVEPHRIVSLTWLSWEPEATPPEYAHVLKQTKKNRGLAEEVLMMEPDLIVSGSFSARFSNTLMARLGKNIVLFDSEQDFEDWYANIRKMGQAVGEPDRAEAMIDEFRAQLAAMQAEIGPGEKPLYAELTVNNWMPGRDTLTTQVVNAGGFRTVGEVVGYSGYRNIPLEDLIQMDIALISTNRQTTTVNSLARASLGHPLLRLLADRALARVDIPERYQICTTPETLKMIRELVNARKAIDHQRASQGTPQAFRPG